MIDAVIFTPDADDDVADVSSGMNSAERDWVKISCVVLKRVS